MLLSAVGGPGALTRLSQLLRAVQPSLRVHVELSTFTDEATLRRVIEHVVQYSDSLGLNEQELPAVRRLLVNWHGHAAANTGHSGHSTVDSGHSGDGTKEHSGHGVGDSGHSAVDSGHGGVDSGHDTVDEKGSGQGRMAGVRSGHGTEEDVGHHEMSVEDSSPSLAAVLDDARLTFRLLRHLTSLNQRPFSRLHMHTLAFQVLTTVLIKAVARGFGLYLPSFFASFPSPLPLFPLFPVCRPFPLLIPPFLSFPSPKFS